MKAEKTKDTCIQLRISKSEKRRLQKAAKQTKTNVAKFVRDAALNAVMDMERTAS